MIQRGQADWFEADFTRPEELRYLALQTLYRLGAGVGFEPYMLGSEPDSGLLHFHGVRLSIVSRGNRPKSLSIKIRETTVEDVLTVGPWYLQFYQELEEDEEFGLGLPEPKPEPSKEMAWFLQFQESCAKGNAIGLVAESEGEIVGFCEVNRRRPNSPMAHRGGLTISVKKQFRGMGIGSMLLEQMIKRCMGEYESLELEVFAGNEIARRFYVGHGFKPYGSRPQSVKRRGKYFEEELMQLRLDGPSTR